MSNKSNYVLLGILAFSATACFGVGMAIHHEEPRQLAPPSVAVPAPYVPAKEQEQETKVVAKEYNGLDHGSDTAAGIQEVNAIPSDYRYPNEVSVGIERFSDGFIQQLTREGEGVKEALLSVLSQYSKDFGVNADIFHFEENHKTAYENHTCYNIRAAGSIIHVHVAGFDSVVACIE